MTDTPLQEITASSRGTPEPAGQIGLLPPIFSNQDLINAFFEVWGEGGYVAALERAGLDVEALAQDRPAHYAGAPIHGLTGLSLPEREEVLRRLLTRIARSPIRLGRVTAPAGLNLRFGPDQEPVLAQLSQGTPLRVLHQQGDWLFVVVAEEQAGYVFAAYVGEGDGDPTPHQDTGQDTGTAQGGQSAGTLARPGALAADGDFLALPMAATDPIRLASTAGQGARTLAHIWNSYGNLLSQLARKLELDVGTAVAVLAVESAGRAFGDDGRMIIRFENHLFYGDWGRNRSDLFFSHFDFDRQTNWQGHVWRSRAQIPFQEFHGSQAAEWQVLDFAANLDDIAAKRSISMGAPQILGRNHRRIGYDSVQAMFTAFQSGDRAQILGLFDFIRADPAMVTALRQGNFHAFASGYNGSGQAALYAGLIQERIAAFNRLRSTSFGPEGAALDSALDEVVSFLPVPRPADIFIPVLEEERVPQEAAPQAGQPGPTVDAAVLDAWRTYTREALANNSLMFKRLLRAFMLPYYLTVAMYVAMFALGIGLFVVAVILGARGQLNAAALFGGLSVITFLSYFLGKPLQSLEENLLLITWLGLIYNTYWNRLLYLQDEQTIHKDLEDATTDAIREIQKLIQKSDELRSRRPGLR